MQTGVVCEIAHGSFTLSEDNEDLECVECILQFEDQCLNVMYVLSNANKIPNLFSSLKDTL